MIKSNIRPILAITYALIILADFLFFPIAWNFIQYLQQIPITQYQPITLNGSGLIHLALGSFITTYAFGRTREKISEIQK